MAGRRTFTTSRVRTGIHVTRWQIAVRELTRGFRGAAGAVFALTVLPEEAEWNYAVWISDAGQYANDLTRHIRYITTTKRL